MSEQIETTTYWVWTDKAVQLNKFRDIEAGVAVWENYRKRAPKRWVDEGLIQEATEDYHADGQVQWDF
ncbi:hypothetical protein [Paenibacillus maysiensis]|uniref:hypothetical protein n=1 Tax=Paenibacillus maysiensis TaxID=1155954 RepID=UPI0004B39201|nr:hypothetical protein [Paenibacillus maysiensis]